jgi:glutamine---fructose-6-phosphate transaminase (isomerizing)
MTNSRYSIQEMERQTNALASDLRSLIGNAEVGADRVVRRMDEPVERIALIGSGDSLNAAMSCRPAFAQLSRVECTPMSATEFMHHPPWTDVCPPRSAVVGISASGGNPTVVAAIDAARRRGYATVAITGNPDSPLAAAAGSSIVVPLTGLEPSPGIRTFQATSVALLFLAKRLAHANTADEQARSGTFFAGLNDLARLETGLRRSTVLAQDSIATTVEALAVAALVVIVGTGPGLGTAKHAAAKVMEAAGVPAMGTDPEEWWHVQRFGHDSRQPVLFVATPGRGREAVLATARRTAVERPVVLVADENDREAQAISDVILPVAHGLPEVFRPLVDPIFAGPLAAGLAQSLDRVPFARS